MIADLKPYPEYRESGVNWLGAVPVHWSVSRIKTVLREKDHRSIDGSGVLLSLTRVRGLIPHKEMTSKVHSAKTLAGYKLYCNGEIVMNRMQAWSGMFGAGGIEGLVSPDYAVFEIIGGHKTSLILARLKAPDLVGQFALESKGIGSGFNRLYTDRLGPIPISLPPPTEQAAIVRFLDHVNRRIEKTIRAKKKIIALLNEQKQVIINQAVTQGINSEWKNLPVRAVLRPTRRVGSPGKTLLSLFRDFGVIPKDSRENKNVDVRDLSLCQRVKPGDVVMNKMKAWQGSIAVSALEGIVSPDYMVLEFICGEVVHKFFHYLLRSPNMVAEYRRRAYGVRPGQWRLMFPDFCRLRLNVPPIHVQESIVSHVETATTDLERRISLTKHEIDLLREYRTRLIADVVTGKLDVREAAARLPDEVEEITVEAPDDDSDDSSEEVCYDN